MTTVYPFLTIILAMAFMNVPSCIKQTDSIKFPIHHDLKNQTQLYRNDKKSIEHSLIANVESFRLQYRRNEGFSVNGDSIDDDLLSGYELYNGYARLSNRTLNKTLASPVKTECRISVDADTIVYNPDSLLCVVLIMVKDRRPILLNPSAREDSIVYDGLSCFGMRKNKREKFYLFPFGIFSTSGNSYELARNILHKFYFKELSGNEYNNARYDYGIGEKEFFSSDIFKPTESGHYSFEYYKDRGKKLYFYKYGEDSL